MFDIGIAFEDDESDPRDVKLACDNLLRREGVPQLQRSRLILYFNAANMHKEAVLLHILSIKISAREMQQYIGRNLRRGISTSDLPPKERRIAWAEQDEIREFHDDSLAVQGIEGEQIDSVLEISRHRGQSLPYQKIWASLTSGLQRIKRSFQAKIPFHSHLDGTIISPPSHRPLPTWDDVDIEVSSRPHSPHENIENDRRPSLGGDSNVRPPLVDRSLLYSPTPSSIDTDDPVGGEDNTSPEAMENSTTPEEKKNSTIPGDRQDSATTEDPRRVRLPPRLRAKAMQLRRLFGSDFI